MCFSLCVCVCSDFLLSTGCNHIFAILSVYNYIEMDYGQCVQFYIWMALYTMASCFARALFIAITHLGVARVQHDTIIETGRWNASGANDACVTACNFVDRLACVTTLLIVQQVRRRISFSSAHALYIVPLNWFFFCFLCMCLAGWNCRNFQIWPVHCRDREHTIKCCCYCCCYYFHCFWLTIDACM